MSQADPNSSARPASEIDTYLLSLARHAVQSFPDAWVTFVQAAERQTEWMDSKEAAQLSPLWRRFADLGEGRFSEMLLADNDLGRKLRRVAPFYSIVPRASQQQILRDSALGGSQGEDWRQRWAGHPGTNGMAETIVETLLAALGERGRLSFSEFVTASGNTKWLLAADFCLHDATRVNDVFAFTLFAHDTSFDDRAAEIRAVAARDLKNIRDVSDEMLSYLIVLKRT
jgi:hypothetical protein